MKKAVIIIVIVAMFGYAIYEFVDRDKSTTGDDTPDNQITASGSGSNDNQEENDQNEEVIDHDDKENRDVNNSDNNKDDTEANTELQASEHSLEQGDMAPDFELELLETGETVKLSDFQGEKVLLNFWATWCGPCRAEMPDMQKLHENEDVVILAVNLTSSAKDELDNVPDFLEEFGLTFDVLLDEENDVAKLYEIKPIPTSYLINSDGTIANIAYGALNYDMMLQGFESMD